MSILFLKKHRAIYITDCPKSIIDLKNTYSFEE